MGLEEGHNGHFGMLGLQSSMLQGLWKEGGSVVMGSANPDSRTKRGSSNKTEMNTFKIFLDIELTLTQLFLNCQSKK